MPLQLIFRLNLQYKHVGEGYLYYIISSLETTYKKEITMACMNNIKSKFEVYEAKNKLAIKGTFIALRACLFLLMSSNAYASETDATDSNDTESIMVTVTDGITLTETDGQKYYDLGEGSIPYNGTITITTGDSSASGTLRVSSGYHSIVLDNASFNGGWPAIGIDANATLDITLVGENIAHSGYMSPGIDVPSEATLIFNEASTGSIDCAGEDNANAMNRGFPGIGSGSSMGTLIVNGGHVVAHAAEGKAGAAVGYRKANAIGTRCDMQSGNYGNGGTVIINGGTVEAIGKSDIPALGGFAWSSTKGNLTMTGGELIIGTGGSMLDSVQVSNALVIGQLSGRQSISDSLVNGTVNGSYTLSKNVEDDITVPQDATLTIPEGSSVSVGKLNVEENGSLVVNGELAYSELVNNGTVSGDGSFAGDKIPATLENLSTSNRTYDGSPVPAEAVSYTYEGNGEVVLTWYTDNSGSCGELLTSAPIDAGTYWVSAAAPETGLYESATTQPVSLTIFKAVANVTITMPDEVMQGEEFQVEFAIDNAFNNIEGLPTADQISFTSDDATVKSVVQKENVYAATMVANESIEDDEITVHVVISDAAQNYEQGSELVGSTEVLHEKPEGEEGQKPEGTGDNGDDTKGESSANNAGSSDEAYDSAVLAETGDKTPCVALIALAVSALVGFGALKCRKLTVESSN